MAENYLGVNLAHARGRNQGRGVWQKSSERAIVRPRKAPGANIFMLFLPGWTACLRPAYFS